MHNLPPEQTYFYPHLPWKYLKMPPKKKPGKKKGSGKKKKGKKSDSSKEPKLTVEEAIVAFQWVYFIFGSDELVYLAYGFVCESYVHFWERYLQNDSLSRWIYLSLCN